jgi:hypothetical protein
MLPRPSPAVRAIAVAHPSLPFVLADSAMRALLDEFLTRHGNQVQLSRIALEDVGPTGEALPETRVSVEGLLMRPLSAGGYERIDVSLGFTARGGFQEGRSTTKVADKPAGPFFAIDMGLCLTIERLLATLQQRNRRAEKFHHIVFSYVAGRPEPVWTVELTRSRLLGSRREKAVVDDVTGECELALF